MTRFGFGFCRLVGAAFLFKFITYCVIVVSVYLRATFVKFVINSCQIAHFALLFGDWCMCYSCFGFEGLYLLPSTGLVV